MYPKHHFAPEPKTTPATVPGKYCLKSCKTVCNHLSKIDRRSTRIKTKFLRVGWVGVVGKGLYYHRFVDVPGYFYPVARRFFSIGTFHLFTRPTNPCTCVQQPQHGPNTIISPTYLLHHHVVPVLETLAATTVTFEPIEWTECVIFHIFNPVQKKKRRRFFQVPFFVPLQVLNCEEVPTSIECTRRFFALETYGRHEMLKQRHNY